MNAKKPTNTLLSVLDSKRLLSINEAVVYLGIGRSTAIQYLEDIGAKRKIGKRTLYDKKVIDSVLDNKEEYRHGRTK